MKFEELERRLNEEINNDKSLQDPRKFNGKDALKNWIIEKVKEIVDKDLIRQDWDDKNNKFQIKNTYNGKDNYLDIVYKDYCIGEIAFKYTYVSSSSDYGWWRNTYYGLKSIEVNIYSSIKSDNFADCKEEMRRRENNDNSAQRRKKQKNIKEIKEFLDKNNCIANDLIDILAKIKELDYSEQRQFNDDETIDWYKIR